MARIAERLILLNDATQGLMARIHFLLSFKKPPVLDSTMDKICQKLVKKFPDFQVNAIEKGPAYNLFKQHAIEVHSSLYSYYYTLVDVARVKDESIKLLNDVAGDILDLTFDVMRDLTIWFMDLLTNIVQLLLLVDRLDGRKEFITIFAYAFYFTQSTYEPNFQKLSKFLIDCTAPIRQLQEDCEKISHRVIHTLLALSPKFVENCQFVIIREKGYLNLADFPDQLSKSANSDLYFELQNMERFRKWILYGFVVVPSALEKDEVRDAIRLTLQFGLVIPIYRDHSINVHELYSQLFTSSSSKKLKLSKTKEIAKAAYLYAINESVAEHSESRCFLRATVSVLVSLLKTAPGLLPPKLPVLLAALSLCKQEIFWYFSHLSSRNIMQKDWSKWSQLEGYDDEYISELLFHVNSLVALAKGYSDIIKQYYLTYLTQGIESLSSLSEKLKNDTRLSNYSANLLQAAIDFKCECDSFEAFVLNCHRLSAQLMSAQSGSRNPATKALIVHLNSVIFRAQCVDMLPNLLRTCGSLSQLFYFKPELKESFAVCLCSRGHIPRYCISFISVFAEAKDNLHRFCPEENATIASDSVRLAEDGMTEIASAICNSFRALSSNLLQISTEVTNGNGLDSRFIPESHPLRNVFRSVEASRQLCANLCTAIRACPTIQVYDQKLCSGQYLVQSVRNNLKEVFRAAALSYGNVEIPSKFRFKSKFIFRAIQEIQAHAEIGIESLFREVLLEEINGTKQGEGESSPTALG